MQIVSRVLSIIFLAGCLAHSVAAQITFIPNQNQWNEKVLYQADIASGRAFFGTNKITFAYYCSEDLRDGHEFQHDYSDSSLFEGQVDYKVRCYSFEVNFVGAELSGIDPAERRLYNVNYFIGNDHTEWASNVPVYEKLTYEEIYPGIDVQYYGIKNQLKYDFIVAPGSNPSQIKMRYNGLRSIRMDGENLILDLGFMQIREVIPYSYQLRNGVREEVKCRFILNNNEVSFVFPEGYNASLPLVIDPVVVASTYSGATCVTGGFSATFDDEGNIYSAGDAFGLGFPVTLGAYDVSHNGSVDLAISKFNADGSSLLYCTYIGGYGMEFPNNMTVTNGKLYVFGATFSGDFPVTAQAFDQVMDGICDVYICCLDITGSNLLASTFVGGASGEGSSLLCPYYPDRLRGEIQIAANGDVLACCSSMSLNFPVTPGAIQSTSMGSQDAVIFRMNSLLSTMVFATYLGSGVHDIALGIREAGDGSIFVCGVTNNMFIPFPTVAGCYHTVTYGGADAFLVKINGAGTALLASTLFGGPQLDAAYYIDIDKDGDVYIAGLARQGAPVSDDVFFVPGGTTFIAKFDPSLTELIYSTVVGAPLSNFPAPPPPGPPPAFLGPNPLRQPNNALTAFMVDECERIYIAGYTGPGRWPLTDDALFQYGGDCQFTASVLEENASSLLSSTMYTGKHIDGGSGHFDKNGVLYQAACINDSTFNVVPWAFSDGSVRSVWDICVFKLDMHSDLADGITMPNVFTPNNDGINDYFETGKVITNFYELTIYDRFGIQVFKSGNQLEVWDGTYNGNNCSDGVYFYSLKYNFCTEPREKNGFVQLAR